MTTKMESNVSEPASPKGLWFGFSGAAVAWILAGILDVFFAWQACMGGEAGSSMFTETWIWVVLGIITFGALAISVAAGLVSFRNWHKVSEKTEFARAEGRSRNQFVTMVGVFVSASMAAGIIWFAIPIYLLRMCERVH